MSVHEPFEPSRAMGNEAVEKTESYGPGADRHVFENVKRSSEVTDLLAAARFAAQEAQDYGQQRVDELVAAVAGEFSRKSLADQLGRLTSEETGMGRWDHLSELLQRRILGTFADMRYETSVGSIGLDERLGTRIIARPVGVVAITTPATAPCSSVVANTLATLKTRNAAVFASNPRSLRSVSLTVEVIRTILEALDAPVDLVQATSGISRGQLEQLMAGADLVVAVGGARTVKRAYSSGTPAIGAGVGNATAIVDGTGNIDDAAGLISLGASYNNGTSCSSESNVLVHQSAVAEFRRALIREGAYICSEDETRSVVGVLWHRDGTLARDAIGRSAAEIGSRAGLELPDGVALLVLIGQTLPFDSGRSPAVESGEKLAPLLTLYEYDSWDDAVDATDRILERQGLGHSCSLHTSDETHVTELSDRIRVARVMVNQSTAIGNSGAFNNGLPFTATVASGTWGGCSVSENVTWRHFLNRTTISTPIEARIPEMIEGLGIQESMGKR